MKIFDTNIELNLDSAKLWQYDKARNLNALIDNEQAFADDNLTAYWQQWYQNHFNLQTANSVGLDLWGLILGLSRPQVSGVPFSDEQYRKLLMAQVMLYNSNGSIYDINKFLKYIFLDKSILLVDGLDMSISIYFLFAVSDEDMAVLANENFLPRPAGVLLRFIIMSEIPFGFNADDPNNWSPFDNVPFWR